jgi:hypothetical protein
VEESLHTQAGCLVSVSKKHDEKTGWGPWIRAEETTCGPVLPESSRKSCSESPAKSSSSAKADKERLEDPLIMERSAGEVQETVKTVAKISDASSNPCLTHNANPSTARNQGLKGVLSNRRKRKIVGDTSTHTPSFQGVTRGHNAAGNRLTGAGRVQGFGNKVGQVYKPKKSSLKRCVFSEPNLEGAKKKTKREGQVAPDPHIICQKSLEGSSDQHFQFSALSAPVVAKNATPRCNSVGPVASSSPTTATGSGGGSVQR